MFVPLECTIFGEVSWVSPGSKKVIGKKIDWSPLAGHFLVSEEGRIKNKFFLNYILSFPDEMLKRGLVGKLLVYQLLCIMKLES